MNRLWLLSIALFIGLFYNQINPCFTLPVSDEPFMKYLGGLKLKPLNMPRKPTSTKSSISASLPTSSTPENTFSIGDLPYDIIRKIQSGILDPNDLSRYSQINKATSLSSRSNLKLLTCGLSDYLNSTGNSWTLFSDSFFKNYITDNLSCLKALNLKLDSKSRIENLYLSVVSVKKDRIYIYSKGDLDHWFEQLTSLLASKSFSKITVYCNSDTLCLNFNRLLTTLSNAKSIHTLIFQVEGRGGISEDSLIEFAKKSQIKALEIISLNTNSYEFVSHFPLLESVYSAIPISLNIASLNPRIRTILVPGTSNEIMNLGRHSINHIQTDLKLSDPLHLTYGLESLVVNVDVPSRATTISEIQLQNQENTLKSLTVNIKVVGEQPENSLFSHDSRQDAVSVLFPTFLSNPNSLKELSLSMQSGSPSGSFDILKTKVNLDRLSVSIQVSSQFILNSFISFLLTQHHLVYFKFTVHEALKHSEYLSLYKSLIKFVNHTPTIKGFGLDIGVYPKTNQVFSEFIKEFREISRGVERSGVLFNYFNITDIDHDLKEIPQSFLTNGLIRIR